METVSEIRSDWELLREYVADGSERAFAEIVARHAGLVFSVAFRRCGDRALAEEASNTVFVTLAQKAARIGGEVCLSGWLFNTARNAAANLRASEARRKKWIGKLEPAEPEAENELAKAWEMVAEELDQAVADLEEADRRVILLRFYEGRSLRELGEALEISEEAARKRVSRAVERLRERLRRKGVMCAEPALNLALTMAVESAPTGMVERISARVARCPPAANRAAPWWLIPVAVAVVAVFFILWAEGPLRVFDRQMKAMAAGDGDAYVETVNFATPEEEQIRPLLQESIRLQHQLQEDLRRQFGEDAFNGSGLARVLEVVDVTQVSRARLVEEEGKTSVITPWGSRLLFVRTGWGWRFDLFRMPGMPGAAQYGSNTRRRNETMRACLAAFEEGRIANAREAASYFK